MCCSRRVERVVLIFFSTFFSPQFNRCGGPKEATLFNKTGLEIYWDRLQLTLFQAALWGLAHPAAWALGPRSPCCQRSPSSTTHASCTWEAPTHASTFSCYECSRFAKDPGRAYRFYPAFPSWKWILEHWDASIRQTHTYTHTNTDTHTDRDTQTHTHHRCAHTHTEVHTQTYRHTQTHTHHRHTHRSHIHRDTQRHMHTHNRDTYTPHTQRHKTHTETYIRTHRYTYTQTIHTTDTETTHTQTHIYTHTPQTHIHTQTNKYWAHRCGPNGRDAKNVKSFN